MSEPVLTLSEAASAKLHRLHETNDRRGMAVRVTVREDGPAAFRDGVVLLVDAESVPLLSGATLDFVDDLTGTGFKFNNPNKPPLLRDPLGARVHELLESRINPDLAAHGGHVSLMDVRDTTVYLRFGGGCQGCGMIDATLKQGIEVMLKEQISDLSAVVDVTDHAAGDDPYYRGE